MSAADKAIEQEAAEMGTAPRVLFSDIQAKIVGEHYFTAAEGAIGAAFQAHESGPFDADDAVPDLALDLLTFCVLVLRNGFTVTGESACASPENFNAATGRKYARENAINKVWMLEGYMLKERLYQATQPAQSPE